MNITVNINSTDRTSSIQWPSFKIIDNVNDSTNTCTFTVLKYGDRTYAPSNGDTIEVLDGSDKIFAGTITKTTRRATAKIEYYDCECVDETWQLDKQNVVETFEDQSVSEIIEYIIDNYTTGFTYANVNCDIFVKTISFNYLPVSKCIEKLAKITNYYWYVDYDKDIHFFEKNTETAPFDLEDSTGKYIWDSLVIKEDITQLKNKITVKGGEIVGEEKTEELLPTSAEFNFPLANKYSSQPVVKYGATLSSAVTLDVGIDYLNEDTGYDVMWNFNEKYLRSTSTFSYTSGHKLFVTGNPLIPIVVELPDATSVATYGEYEFYIEDESISSKEEAVQRASAELEGYANGINSGEFRTYESGLSSGQLINVNSTIRGLDEDFSIQSVSLSMRGPNSGEWKVKLATLKIVGIIQILQDLLLKDRYKEPGEIVLYKYEEDHQTALAKEEYQENISTSVPKTWVYGPYYPTTFADTKRAFRYNRSFLYY